MADVVGALPHALERRGWECFVLLPHHQRIHKGPAGDVVATWGINVGNVVHRVSLLEAGAGAYLVHAPTAFDRDGLYDDPATGRAYPDSLFRTLILQHAARLASRDVFRPDLVHCHDHHTGLLPAYLADDGGPPCLLTIHNLAYQGRYPAADFALTGFRPERMRPGGPFEFHGDFSMLKAGIAYAAAVTTVSPTYAAEIVRPEHGCGLDGVLRERRDRLVGVCNGIDEEAWDPQTDPAIPAPYSAADPAGKEICRRVLRERTGLAAAGDAPVCGVVSRVTEQKGLDLLPPLLPWLVEQGAQFVLLGAGDPRLLDLFRGAQGRWPGRVAVLEGYDGELARLVYAGSDLMLIPSRFEPCGLTQMYGMRYGAVPVATRTGGLVDTVQPFDFRHLDGVGVLADGATTGAFHAALDFALAVYRRPELWRRLRRNGMTRSFSWDEPANAYAQLYERVLEERLAGARR